MTSKANELRYARYEIALKAAYEAASRAQEGLKENLRAFDCGFAWVVSRDLAFNAYMRKRAKEMGSDRYYGSKNWNGGWCFWKPGSFEGQSISIHEVGAKAFRDVLAHELQIQVEAGSRLD